VKLLPLGLACAVAGALALGLAAVLAAQAGLPGSWGVDIGFGALWAVAFVLVIGEQRVPVRDGILWGAAFGFLGWFVGPLSLGGLIAGDGVRWELSQAASRFPELCGFIAYGLVIGVTRSTADRIRNRRVPSPAGLRSGALTRGGLAAALTRGGVAGLVAGLVLIRRLPSMSLFGGSGTDGLPLGSPIDLLLALAAGALLAAVIAQAQERAGVSLIRGFAYGLLWWFVVQLTMLPLLRGEAVTWDVGTARASIGSLLSLMLFGSIAALVYRGLTALEHALFADDVGLGERGDGIGSRNLRAIVWGATGSLLGGLAFTVVMVQAGALPRIAGIVGGSSSATGLVVHFVISIIIGALYALLFGGRTTSVGTAAVWGTVYGLFWWTLGPVTLLPILLGEGDGPVRAAALAAFPGSFIGHIVYGVMTAVYVHLIGRRHREEDRPRTVPADATVAPLWLVVSSFAVLVPVLLG